MSGICIGRQYVLSVVAHGGDRYVLYFTAHYDRYLQVSRWILVKNEIFEDDVFLFWILRGRLARV